MRRDKHHCSLLIRGPIPKSGHSGTISPNTAIMSSLCFPEGVDGTALANIVYYTVEMAHSWIRY